MRAASITRMRVTDAQPETRPTERKPAAVRPNLPGLSSFLEPLLANANDLPEDNPGPAAAPPPAAVVPSCPFAATLAAAVDDNTAPATATALAHAAESCRMPITCMRTERSLCLLLLLPGPSTAVLDPPSLGGEVFVMIGIVATIQIVDV